jgi:hypothetical protein
MTNQDLVQRFSSANPITDNDAEATLTADQWQEMFERIVSDEIPRRRHAPSRPRWTRMRVAALVAGGLAIAIVVPTLWTDGPTGASAAAAEVLHAAARVAEKQPPAPVPTDGYRYTKSKDAYRGHYDACSMTPPIQMTCPAPPPDDWEFSVLVPHTREIWIAPDGSGRLRVQSGQPKFFGPEDEVEWEAAGRPSFDGTGISDDSFGPGGLSFTDFSEYSTDPDELYDQIRSRAEGHGPSTDAEMFVLVGDLLRETVAPPDLRAALFRVAAKIPGVELVGNVTDPAGRNGVAVARTSDDAGFLERNELVFDPDTSELLAERQALLERVAWADAEPGTVIGYAVYLSSGAVETTSDRP